MAGADAEEQARRRYQWAQVRRDYLRYYALRAGVMASKGSHDEWNILRLLNDRRVKLQPSAGVGGRIPAFFDGRQIDLASLVAPVPLGYEIETAHDDY